LIEKLVNYYHENLSHLPLIINTQGWVQDLGRELLIETVSQVRPTLISQFVRHNRALPPLSGEILSSIPFNITCIDSSNLPVKIESDKNYLFSLLHREFNRSPIYTAPSDHRIYRILAYFKFSEGPFANTYSVPWKVLNIHFVHDSVPPSQTFWTLNASLVGLGITLEEVKNTNNEYPNIYMPGEFNTAIKFIGFGIIKTIDIDNKKIEIISPLGFDEIKKVNVILKGKLEIPHQFLLQGFKSPYLGIDYVSRKHGGAFHETWQVKHDPSRSIVKRPDPDNF